MGPYTVFHARVKIHFCFLPQGEMAFYVKLVMHIFILHKKKNLFIH